MRLPRACGILLHPTSLPGPFGIGDLGPAAFEFADFLARTGQRWWQMLPLGPTGYGNSPYQSHSSYAGNPYLISPESLRDEGLLDQADLDSAPAQNDVRVDFDAVAEFKSMIHRKAFARWRSRGRDPAFDEFAARESHWLDDYAMYMAIKCAHNAAAWTEWERGIAHREPSATDEWRAKVGDEVHFRQFEQYVFDAQWKSLRAHCRALGLRLIGDLPIFVAHDSADVWARPDLFQLDESGRPIVKAGVPGDYFNEDGQLWGNPLYDWQRHADEGFAWWIGRLRATIERFELTRLDHFRGFEAYWEVPGDAQNARVGRWALGPGVAFLEAIKFALGGLPLIAEDLGQITPEVEFLRDGFELPGMKILQFAFSGDAHANSHLPFRFVPHCVVYTGTHDNDTTVGWFRTDPEHAARNESREAILAERAFASRYLGTNGSEINWDLIRLAFGTVADTAIIPLQDLLGLASDARMNLPGEIGHYWEWRFRHGELTDAIADRLAEMTATFARWNRDRPESTLGN